MPRGSAKNLGRLVYVAPYLCRGRSPPYSYNTKYTSLPRVFDTPSSHSNFNSNSKKNKRFFVKKLFYISVWNLNWNWNWDESWNDLRECQKLWGCLCILHRTYTGGFAPPITTMQNTQALPEFLTLHQVIPTSIPIL